MLNKKFWLLTFLIFTIVASSFLCLETINADSGWDSSYDSGGSSDFDSSWDSGSSWDGYSSGGSYSSSTSGSNMPPYSMAIIFELFCSIHYFVFAFLPLGALFKDDKKQAMKLSILLFVSKGLLVSLTILFKKSSIAFLDEDLSYVVLILLAFKLSIILFIIRAIIIVIGDIISPYYFIIDFISLFLIAFIVIPVITIFKHGDKKNKYFSYNKKNYVDINSNVALEYGIDDLELLKQKLYEKYVAIQESWMNFDYHSLQILLTDELYNMYYSQLVALKTKQEKNIMSGFELVNSKIYDIVKTNDVITLKLYLHVKMYDYVVDYYNKVVRGNDKKKIDIEYEITFQKSVEKSIDVCPNCGAKIEDNASVVCPYCNSTIINNSSNWVMSKKECIGQK